MKSSAVSCARPTIDNAVVTPEEETVAYQASYTVMCNTGYEMSGDNTVTCGADGRLEDTLPTCQRKFLMTYQFNMLSDYIGSFNDKQLHEFLFSCYV